MLDKQLGRRNDPDHPGVRSTGQRETSMLKRGDILVERLTGKKAMVIDVASPEVITCRFADGRLEDRFTFEIDLAQRSLFASLVSLATSLLWTKPKEYRESTVITGAQPRLARRSGSP